MMYYIFGTRWLSEVTASHTASSPVVPCRASQAEQGTILGHGPNYPTLCEVDPCFFARALGKDKGTSDAGDLEGDHVQWSQSFNVGSLLGLGRARNGKGVVEEARVEGI